MKTFSLNRSIAAVLATALLFPGAAQAASVILWPVDPVIRAGEKASALWLENKGSAPITLQVRTLAWKQDNGEENYDQQDDVVASPPIATVPPGKRQLVRIIRRGQGTSPNEHTYRLLIDELPPVVDPNGPKAASVALSVQMRYSVPLFTYDMDQSAPRLTARFATQQGKKYIVINNAGTQHARLLDLRMHVGGSDKTMLPGLFGYVLPGSTMRWAMPVDAPADGKVLVNVNGSDMLLSLSA